MKGAGISARLRRLASANRDRQRRLRRFAVYPLLLATVLWLRPTAPPGSALVDALLDAAGLAVAAMGQAVRLWAWGANAQPDAMLRTRGPYALMRHPLYTGNFLILAGLLLIFHSPGAYVLFLSAFAYLYCAVSTAEEEQMRRRCGPAYDAYVQRCPSRFVPDPRRLRRAVCDSHPFRWSHALHKEYESMLGWTAGALVLLLHEQYLLEPRSADSRWIFVEAASLAAIGVAAAALYALKRRRRRALPVVARGARLGRERYGGSLPRHRHGPDARR